VQGRLNERAGSILSDALRTEKTEGLLLKDLTA